MSGLIGTDPVATAGTDTGSTRLKSASSRFEAEAAVLAIPVAAGVFYPSLGWSLRLEISALWMSLSSIIVALNTVCLRRVKIVSCPPCTLTTAYAAS